MHLETSLGQNGRAFRCRPVVSTDLQSLCSLMTEVGASFAGLTSRSMCFAIGSDAVAANRVTIAVADHDKELIGFVAAVVDPAEYWKGFLWRHPMVGTTAVVHKLLRGGGRTGLLRGGRGTGIDHWNQSSPSIARILYVGVAERFRRKGIGAQLYQTVFHMLAESGVQHAEAHTDHDNIPSIRLFAQIGGHSRMVKGGTGLLWTLDLSFIRGGKGAP